MASRLVAQLINSGGNKGGRYKLKTLDLLHLPFDQFDVSGEVVGVLGHRHDQISKRLWKKFHLLLNLI